MHLRVAVSVCMLCIISIVMVAYIVSVNAVVIMGCECVSRHFNLLTFQINCGFSFFLMSLHAVFTVIKILRALLNNVL